MPTFSEAEWRGFLASTSPHVFYGDERGGRFAALIRTARKQAGMSQDDLAEQSGVSRSTMVRWEGGRAERPDPDQVRVVCRILGIDPREAAIALGFLTREEAYGEPKLNPKVEEVIQLLQDPAVSEEEKHQWIEYLRYLRLRNMRHHGKPELTLGETNAG